MSGKIYLVQGEGQLVAMTEQAYDTEDVLQGLLANYPDLLAGEQINPESPRRWLLLSREASLPSEEGGAGRWSVDHLFVDQDGIPTIVEVKRSTDTRIRREVVGQMLDYAANAVVYWPVETLRAQFEAQSQQDGSKPDERILASLGLEDADSLWQMVRTNLQAGRVRMVFVSDTIPVELRRVIDFLRTQMSPAEVHAIEVRQYIGQDQQVLVPRAVSQARFPTKSTNTTSSRSWFKDLNSSEVTLLITQTWQADQAKIVDQIVEWADRQGLVLTWRYNRYEGIYPFVEHGNKRYRLFSIKITGDITIELRVNRRGVARFEGALWAELISRLSRIPGISMSADDPEAFPSVPLLILEDQRNLNEFLDTFDWVTEEIRSA